MARITSLAVALLLAAALLSVPAMGASPPATRPLIVKVEKTGFHWMDAAVGAATALGAVSIAAALRALRSQAADGEENP